MTSYYVNQSSCNLIPTTKMQSKPEKNQNKREKKTRLRLATPSSSSGSSSPGSGIPMFSRPTASNATEQHIKKQLQCSIPTR